MKSDVRRSLIIATAVTLALVALVVIGSRNLRHFDAALVAYTFATIFAAFGITYRYSMWLQRPPTALYRRRGTQLFWQKGKRLRNLGRLGRTFVDSFVKQTFIERRSRLRWIMHGSFFWGVTLAFAVTFPLVFGWLHFDAAGDPMHYRIFIFGFPTVRFAVDGLFAWLLFHALDISAVVILIGMGFAFHRRLSDRGAMSVQQFANDSIPLLLLFAISVTGLMLTVSAAYLHGFSFGFMAITHAVTVILFLMYLPFGKFFHMFQRPAQLGISLYKQAGREGPQAFCARCGQAYASQMHVEDLKQVQAQVGLDYRVDGAPGHYQHICPSCRRKVLALTQAAVLRRTQRG